MLTLREEVMHHRHHPVSELWHVVGLWVCVGDEG